MPTIDWNRSWAKNLIHHMSGGLKGDEYGDQWGDPEKVLALKSVCERFIAPFVNKNITALEIGSGGGRWTQYLKICKRLYLVELNPAMFSYIIDRFKNPDNFYYITTHGSDFPLVPEFSLDFVFSFGTLVHLDFGIIESYIINLIPLLKPGAHVALQFSDKRKKAAADNPDFADTTPEMLLNLFKEHGIKVEDMDDNLLAHSAVILGRV